MADLLPDQTIAVISSLNEAWLRTLDDYAVDMPMSHIILLLMRDCFSADICAVLLLRKGHGDQVASDIAGFIAEESQS